MPAPWVHRASAGLPAGLPASLRSQGPLVHHGYLPSQWALGLFLEAGKVSPPHPHSCPGQQLLSLLSFPLPPGPK